MADTERGHCWGCLKSGDKVVCPHCKVGVYCSQRCLKHDKGRHQSECLILGPQKCSYCMATLTHRTECAACGDAYYCGRTCQTAHWKVHKTICRMVRDGIRTEARLKRITIHHYLNMKRQVNYPFYFGDTFAVDFLNLKNNEWEFPHRKDDPSLKNDYSILTVGCGDLRSLIFTIAKLPVEFRGNFQVTMCDFDPFIMARNILFLYMMTAKADEPRIEKSITTIWYSLQLPEREQELLKVVLGELVSCTDGESLWKLTKGLVIMEDQEVRVIHQVWKGWYNEKYKMTNVKDEGKLHQKIWGDFSRLQCDKPESVLYKQRSKAVKNVRLRSDIPGVHRPSYDMWMANGRFTGSTYKVRDLKHDNVTLTGRWGSDHSLRYDGGPDFNPYVNPHPQINIVQPTSNYLNRDIIEDGRNPEALPFVYCIQGDVKPYEVWDYLEVKAFGFKRDLEDMYHDYISHVVGLAVRFIRENRLTTKLTIKECRQLKVKGESFDRIFTSNLMEYLGPHPLIRSLGHLLSRSNKHATLVMESILWYEMMDSFIQHIPGYKTRSCMLYKKDQARDENIRDVFDFLRYRPCDETKPETRLRTNLEDYEYEADIFVKFLKATYIATEGDNNNAGKDTVPSSKTVMECEGLTMRDIRKTLNKVVPFHTLGRGRQAGLPYWAWRKTEWFIPE